MRVFKFFAMLGCAVSFCLAPVVSSATPVQQQSKPAIGKPTLAYNTYTRCRTIPGYTRHGHYYPPRRICNRGHGYYHHHRHVRCKYIRGFYRHGVYHPARKVCVRRY